MRRSRFVVNNVSSISERGLLVEINESGKNLPFIDEVFRKADTGQKEYSASTKVVKIEYTTRGFCACLGLLGPEP